MNAADSCRFFNRFSPKTSTQKYTTKNCQSQNFNLPSPIITYISTNSCVIFHQNASSKPSAIQYFALPKLQKTCKYFLRKFKTIPIKFCSIENANLILGGFNSNELNKYSADKFLSKIFKNNLRICFSETLLLITERSTKSSMSSLSMIMEKTAFMVIRKLHLRGQHLTLNEFSFLISSPLLFDVIIDESYIWLNDKRTLAVENIIEKLPNVRMFDYIEKGNNSVTSFTPYTLHRISLLRRNQKFNRFSLSEIPPQKDFDTQMLMNFVEDNSDVKYDENTFTFKFDNRFDQHTKIIEMKESAQLLMNLLSCVFINVL